MNAFSLAKLFGQAVAIAWRSQPIYFLSIIFIDVLQSVIPLVSAWITKLLFDLLADGLLGHTLYWKEIAYLLILQAILAIFTQLLQPANNYLNIELNRQISLQVQITIYKKINDLAGIEPFENPHTRDSFQIGAQGGQMGPSQVLDTISGFLRNSVTLISFLGILITFNPLLGCLVTLAALPQIFVQVIVGRKRLDLADEAATKQRRVIYYGGVFTGTYYMKELRLFDLGEYFLIRFQQLTKNLNHILRTQQLRELRWQSILSVISEGISSIALITVVIQAFQNHLSLGDVMFFTSAVGNVQGALSGIAYSFSNIHESILFFSRYTELMALPQPIVIPTKLRPVSSLQYSIELRGVSFRYSNEHPWVLKDVSFTLPAGSCLALVGLNGAGKTTLVKLLTRMYDPCEGEILWDGVDLRQFDPTDFRGKMGAIFQDFVRFDLTAFENIALGDITSLENGNRKAAEEAARQAAVKAGIHETIQALPQGYDTTLSRWLAEEGQGADLSGGEWQKLALARLFMRQQANLLILDEPTAALDAQAEYDIYSRFVELVNGRTCLLISHRFSTVKMADLIAVLDDGKIIEYGSHQELLTQGGKYARLYNMQADRYH